MLLSNKSLTVIFPEEALREAILNAIAHRDYFSPANIQINIFKNRVEITNPCRLI